MTTTLTYFDFEGSRGLECRLALALAGVAFVDERLGREEFAARKPSLPFGAMPVLTVDGRTVAQSNAILVYVGRTGGLHPGDAWTAAEHEAILQSVEDLRSKLPAARPGMSDDEKKAARQEFAAGWLRRWAQTVSERVRGPFLEGERPHVADVKIAVIAASIRGGVYDHIPGTVLDEFPAIGRLVDALEAQPGVVAYRARR